MKENQNTINDVISVGNVIVGILKAELAGGEFSLPADVDFSKLYTLADVHRVTPLIAGAVLKCDFAPAEVKAKFKKELFKISMRYETQMKEKEALSQVFTENNIKHCFLKGHKLSKYYKIPEQRFMLDMDVYVDSEKIAIAEDILKGRGYEKNSVADDKDIGYIKKPFLNIEIHKELKYDYDKGYEYYKSAFSRLRAVDDTCELNMTNEDFYVYILSHSAHHFATAGTGIRNVLDHYHLKNQLRPLCDESVLKDALQITGLTDFDNRMNKLCDMWFCGAEASEDMQEMAEYIMLSGVFGNKTNHYLGGILRGDYGSNKSSFLLARLFPSRAKTQDRYPILKKFPFLLPIIWVIRIFSAIFQKKNFTAELDNAGSVSQDKKDEFVDFIKKNGL